MAGELPAADYIKTDCESFDPEVLRGTRRYLAQSNILSLTVETDFSVSGTYPRTPFVEINDIAVQHRLLVFDINAVRHPRPAYVAARERHPWPPADPLRDYPSLDVGQPRTYAFVFCRDFVLEHKNPALFADVPDAVTSPTTDKLIKAMINFELHGLMDCAVDIADHFRAQLAKRLDVETAIELLARRPPYARNTADVTECIRMIAALRSLNQQSAARIADTEARLKEVQAENRALQRKLAAPMARARPRSREADCSKSWAGGSGAACRIDRAARRPLRPARRAMRPVRGNILTQKTRAAPLPSPPAPPRRDNARCRWRSRARQSPIRARSRADRWSRPECCRRRPRWRARDTRFFRPPRAFPRRGRDRWCGRRDSPRKSRGCARDRRRRRGNGRARAGRRRRDS